MKYILKDTHKTVDAGSEYEFVKWMRKNDKRYWESNREFMKEYSFQKYYFEKKTIRFNCEKDFVEDLVENGLLQIEAETKNNKSIWELLNKLIRKHFYKQLIFH